MEKLLWVTGGLVALAWLVRVIVRAGRKQRQRCEAAWAEAARRLGGRYVAASGPWWRRTKSRVEVVIGEVPVALETFVVHAGNTHIVYTRTRAATACPRRLKVYRDSVFSSIGKALGMQDLEVGDAAYDQTFVVQSDDEGWARQVLGELLRKEHLESPKLMVRVDEGRVETTQAGLCSDPDELVSRLRFTAALAFAVQPRG